MFEDHKEVQIDEEETDSDEGGTENEEHLELVKRECITRSRQSCSFICASRLVTVSSK